MFGKNTFCLALSETVKGLFNLQNNSEENTPGKVVSSIYSAENRSCANQQNLVPVHRELHFRNDLMREGHSKGRLCHNGKKYSCTHMWLLGVGKPDLRETIIECIFVM